MIRDAAWLLRRYRDRACPDWRVRDILKPELERLIEDRYSGADMEELRRSAPERLTGFDDATDKALQYLAELRFDLALRAIRIAAAALAELRRFAAAASGLETAERGVEELAVLLGPALDGLATPRGLRRLLALTRELLDQGEPRKARFVILLLRSDLARLRTREANPAGRRGLLRALQELGDGPGRAAAERVAHLLEEGYAELAGRLAEDLEVDLAVLDRSRRAAVTPGGTLGPLTASLGQIQRDAEVLERSVKYWLASTAVEA